MRTLSSAFMKKRLEKKLDSCHRIAMEVIDLISEAGIDQMIAEGIALPDPHEIDPRNVAQYACRNLDIHDTEKLVRDYINLLILEDLAEMI